MVEEIFDRIRQQGRKNLTEAEGRELLSDQGIPVVEGKLVMNEEEAVREAERLGWPVALKVVSPDVIHKSDAGGVALGLNSEEEVRRAISEIRSRVLSHSPQAQVEGFLVEKMAPPGALELIIGMIQDASFGPVVMCGLGGVWVEVLRDVVMRVAPVTREEALEMWQELKGARLLTGFRGQPAVDLYSLADIVIRTSELGAETDAIAEIDLNPVAAYPWGAVVLDARIILR